MKIVEVGSRKQMRQFVRVPARIHAGNPCYVPPMWLDEAGAYTKRTRY